MSYIGLISFPDWPAEASGHPSPNTGTQSAPSDAKVLCSPESLLAFVVEVAIVVVLGGRKMPTT